MRQVPRFLLIGNGRLARHMQHYFSLLQLHFESWHRKNPIEELHQQLSQATHVLLLISDNHIDEFIRQNLTNSPATLIHCSGSLISEYAYGAHPLMTFNENLYDLEKYQSISFVIDDDAPNFEELFPGLLNSHFRLQKSKKAKYHALCVLSGNFSCLLWQKLLSTLEEEFGLPFTIAHPYLAQQTQNLLNDHSKALTGPLVRNDINTINKNITALQQDPFQAVYQSFVSCYQKLKEEHDR